MTRTEKWSRKDFKSLFPKCTYAEHSPSHPPPWEGFPYPGAHPYSLWPPAVPVEGAWLHPGGAVTCPGCDWALCTDGLCYLLRKEWSVPHLRPADSCWVGFVLLMQWHPLMEKCHFLLSASCTKQVVISGRKPLEMNVHMNFSEVAFVLLLLFFFSCWLFSIPW